MTVYVESNFTLELAFQQEEATHADRLLQLASEKRIELVYPEFALTEPFSTINRYGNERARFLIDLNRQLSELKRSAPHQPLVADVQPLVTTLTRLQRDQMDRLESVVERMLSCGRSLPLTSTVFDAVRHYEGQFDLSPQDAIVAASVIEDLRRVPAVGPHSRCFVSRNSKDFGSMIDVFDTLNCEYKPRFEAALRFVEANLQMPPNPPPAGNT
jgi:hypothetical protein